jgi:thioredoxin reductase
VRAQKSSSKFDVVVVGAGPAGLSAALILGRARRSVLVCDRDTPRNWASRRMHAFVTREGLQPRRFRAIARRELDQYASVEIRDTEVTSLVRSRSGFEVTLDGQHGVFCRKVLIATGVIDLLPPIPDVERYFGISVFQCPYCDGWELQDHAVAVYGKGRRGFEMARAMTAWTSDIVLCTDGPAALSPLRKAELEQNRIRLVTAKIKGLKGRKGQLNAIVFENGIQLPRTALFFDLPARRQSSLAELMGCDLNRNGRIECGKYAATNVPGVFAAGNVVDDVQLSIVAAAEGAQAAFGINTALTKEDFTRRVRSPR